MSGHSKWSSIKHKKALTDQRKGKLFSKLAAQITLAAKNGTDPTMNPNLRMAIETAKQAEMPKDNIDRAIARGSGKLGGAAVQEITYEIYGPAGVAILVRAISDNPNRTIAAIRAILNKFAGKLADTGSVAYLFHLRGMVAVEPGAASHEEIELKAIDAGAEDISTDDEEIIIEVEPNRIEELKIAITQIPGVVIASAEISLQPKTALKIADPTQTEKIQHLLDALDELDDVVEVVANAEFIS